jgi:hypothetical protein
MSPGAGYSGTPLPVKLGVKPGDAVAWLGAPGDFGATLGDLPPDLRVKANLRGPLDVVVFFTKRRAELARRLPALMRAIAPAGGAWIAWPKRASRIATDVTEDVIRAEALPLGLVDVKVCAIDDTWSGLKLVIRKENR